MTHAAAEESLLERMENIFSSAQNAQTVLCSKAGQVWVKYKTMNKLLEQTDLHWSRVKAE